MVVRTLEAMSNGGIYDHVGGGFHRYSTDAQWLVPHFEKMLYDNAQLIPIYLSAYQITGRQDFAAVARETLDYVAGEMTSADGAFYSATDADSLTPAGQREEGWFFTWTPAEIEQAIGAEGRKELSAVYPLSAGGNFDGRNILRRVLKNAEAAKSLGVTEEQLAGRLAAARRRLYDTRLKRPAPLRDDKVLAAWNGLMVSAFAKGASILSDPGLGQRAQRAAAFLLQQMRREDGQLFRSYQDGRPQLLAYLDDYAFVIQGLLDLVDATSEPSWLAEARALQSTLDRLYWDTANGGYFATSGEHEQLLTRTKPSYDGAEPSGNSVAILNLLRLAELTADDAYRTRAERALAAFSTGLKQSPGASPLMLAALESYLDTPRQVVVVSPPGVRSGPLVAAVRATFLPNRFFLEATEGSPLEAWTTLAPALDGKSALGGKATAFVCERGVCEKPTSDPAVLARQLAKTEPLSPLRP